MPADVRPFAPSHLLPTSDVFAETLHLGELVVSPEVQWSPLVASESITVTGAVLCRLAPPVQPDLSASTLAAFIGNSLTSTHPRLSVTTEGNTVTITACPEQLLAVSVSTTSTGEVHINAEVSPRARGETWGDYAKRRGVSPAPKGQRTDWLQRLRTLAGE
jgi:hypothetical protein